MFSTEVQDLFLERAFTRISESEQHRGNAARLLKDAAENYPAWLDAVFSTALAVERALIGMGLSLPFGGSLIVVAARDE